MKFIAPLSQDGFKASIQLLRFQRELHSELQELLLSIVGTPSVFVKGGSITIVGGNTTITAGILAHNGKLYSFSGGTYTGLPATLNVEIQEATAVGYPQPYFVGNPTPQDIYMARTAAISAAGTIPLVSIGIIDSIKALTDDVSLKSNKDAEDVTSNVNYASGVTPFISSVKRYDNGLVYISMVLLVTTNIPTDTLLCDGLPSSGLSIGIFRASKEQNTIFSVIDIACIKSTGSNSRELIAKNSITASPTNNASLVFEYTYRM